MQAQKDDLNTPVITLIGIVSAILLFAIIVVMQAWFARAEREEHAHKVIAAPAEELAGVTAGQQAQLAGYRWVDREQGVVAIPIERAMALTAQERGPTANPPATAEPGRTAP